MRRNLRRFAPLLILGVIIGAALSITANEREKRQYWKKDFGPLVSHKSFPKDCSLCHVPQKWNVLKSDFHFDHLKETGYRLEGAHAFAACLRCHNDRGPVQSFAARGCAGCHADPHKSTMGFDCSRCHNQDIWKPNNTISLHAQTRFPLTGVHAALDCDKCHSGAQVGNFKGTPADCYFCHNTSYQQAPNHSAMSFPRTCQNCHSASTWSGARFNHATLGSGADCYSCHQPDYQRGPDHVSRGYSHSCQSCHNTVSWTTTGFNHSSLGANPDCYACHSTDFQRGPNHVSGGFSHTCLNCHNTTTWTGAAFNHNSLGANPDCYSCHSADFQRGPNHVSGGFSHTCLNCHNTTTWTGAAFNHNTLGANPLCYNCHQSDYQRGPNHVAMSYPTTCQNCHNTTAWSGASLNHRFPLRSNHNVSCSICHQGGNTATFTCLVCHAHSQSQMDSKHQGRSGYRYDSLLCYQCHPRG